MFGIAEASWAGSNDTVRVATTFGLGMWLIAAAAVVAVVGLVSALPGQRPPVANAWPTPPPAPPPGFTPSPGHSA
jgi:hypothetical protein